MVILAQCHRDLRGTWLKVGTQKRHMQRHMHVHAHTRIYIHVVHMDLD